MQIKTGKRAYASTTRCKLNKKLIDKICKDIELGSTLKLAAISNGIGERTLYDWINQGRLDLSTDNDTLCAYLAQSLSDVQKKEIQACRQMIRESGKGHAGAQWTLERAYWRDFSASAATLEQEERLAALESKMNNSSEDKE